MAAILQHRGTFRFKGVRGAILWCVCLAATFATAQEKNCWSLARVRYGGGGDWYADPTSLPNLMARVRKDLNTNVCSKEAEVDLLDPQLFRYPILYLTGHGTVRFSEPEREVLRDYLFRGGLLWADDNYGLDSSFRQEVERLLPGHSLFELPHGHPVFRSHYAMSGGLPKIHEHDGKRPQLFAVMLNKKIAVLYSYEADLGDGWEDPAVHKVPAPLREKALKMGVNVVAWYLQGQPHP